MRGDGSIDLTASVAGTHIIEHGGRLLALQETNLPYEVTPELDTVGPFDFHGKLTSAMTAHPKQDPATGELHFFSYSPFPPHLTYYVASPEGHITRSQVVDGSGPSLMHDFAITATKAVFLDLPVVAVRDLDPGQPARPAARHQRLRHAGRQDRPRRTRLRPGVLGDLVEVVDRRARLPGRPGQRGPSINGDRTGLPSAISYSVAFPGSGLDEFAIVKLNTTTGERHLHLPGPDRHAGEAVFVPAAGATGEDDGYLLTIVSDLRANASQLLVLDAHDLSTTATVELPRSPAHPEHTTALTAPVSRTVRATPPSLTRRTNSRSTGFGDASHPPQNDRLQQTGNTFRVTVPVGWLAKADGPVRCVGRFARWR
ncbi:hypothetical protein ALI144C_07225 [Actinosynnema sp. ALI-1.44]|nr:hypothetical protein ALI144C_07225 [Actinosynnema sp. ALI-1.44]